MQGVRRLIPTLPAIRAIIAIGLVLVPLLPFTVAPPAGTLTRSSPLSGQTEEEKSEERKLADETSAFIRGSRHVDDTADDRLPAEPLNGLRSRTGFLLRAAISDPFRNGLGCPFRC